MLKQLKEARDLFSAYFQELNDRLEKELEYQQIPIKKLVEIQLESALRIMQKINKLDKNKQ